MLAIATRIVGVGQAEDVVQTAIMKTWAAAQRLDGPDSFARWAIRATQTSAIDVLRSAEHSRTRATEMTTFDELGIESAGPSVESVVVGGFDSEDVVTTLKAMGTQRAKVLLERDGFGMSYDEILADVDMSPRQLRNSLTRARTEFRKRFAAEQQRPWRERSRRAQFLALFFWPGRTAAAIVSACVVGVLALVVLGPVQPSEPLSQSSGSPTTSSSSTPSSSNTPAPTVGGSPDVPATTAGDSLSSSQQVSPTPGPGQPAQGPAAVAGGGFSSVDPTAAPSATAPTSPAPTGTSSTGNDRSETPGPGPQSVVSIAARCSKVPWSVDVNAPAEGRVSWVVTNSGEVGATVLLNSESGVRHDLAAGQSMTVDSFLTVNARTQWTIQALGEDGREIAWAKLTSDQARQLSSCE